MAFTETRIDKILGIGSGTGGRPAAGNPGARWIDTTGPTESYDNGASWAALAGGGGAAAYQWIAKTANYTLVAGDFVAVDTTGGALTMTLPTAVGVTTLLAVRKKTADANKVTIVTTGGQTINGVSTKTLSLTNDVLVFAGDNANWQLAGQHLGDVIQFDYEPASDIINGVTMASGWTDLTTNQSFTVDDAASIVEIVLSAGGLLSTLNQGVGYRLNIDSAGTPVLVSMGGGYIPINNSAAFSGVAPALVTGLAAGSHTVKLQGSSESGTAVLYCRAGTRPKWEPFRLYVVEHKR